MKSTISYGSGKADIDRVFAEVANLNLQLISKTVKELTTQFNQVREESRAVVEKFCKKNKLDIDKISIDSKTGEVSSIEQNSDSQVTN